MSPVDQAGPVSFLNKTQKTLDFSGQRLVKSLTYIYFSVISCLRQFSVLYLAQSVSLLIFLISIQHYIRSPLVFFQRTLPPIGKRSHSGIRNCQYLPFLSAGVFIISFGSARESRCRCSSSASLQSSREITLLRPVTLTIFERTMYAIFRLLTVIFLAM